MQLVLLQQCHLVKLTSAEPAQFPSEIPEAFHNQTCFFGAFHGKIQVAIGTSSVTGAKRPGSFSTHQMVTTYDQRGKNMFWSLHLGDLMVFSKTLGTCFYWLVVSQTPLKNDGVRRLG